ncbi:MAG: glycine cleavage system transcriptional repressor [Actinomycetota bacterium]|jgi:glycine cleavage system transcriptional repressor|nr:glycine cleavage system transcriptional repressor [Actinomycetota bacterium]
MGGRAEMSSHFAVTVIGQDRPGIVAAATRTLYECGCNLEDVTSTILRGHFSMTMIVTSPTMSAGELESALRATSEGSDLLVAVRSVVDADVHVVAPTHMVSVYGSDRPGIVYAVTDLLAKADANITDLTSRIIGSDDQPVYALMLEVALPDRSVVETELSKLRSELGVDVSIHAIEPDLL